MGVPKTFEYMKECVFCRLSKTRQKVVVGRGSVHNVRFFFVGEAPGREEDDSGLPFVGSSGRKLMELVDEVGLDKSSMYVTNIVKCRPPKNRPPTSQEIKRCKVHLVLQLRVTQPQIIVTVGNTALQFFCPKLKIMSVHGQFQTTKKGLKIFPLIHPAAALRNRDWLDLIRQDLRKLVGTKKEKTVEGDFLVMGRKVDG